MIVGTRLFYDLLDPGLLSVLGVCQVVQVRGRRGNAADPPQREGGIGVSIRVYKVDFTDLNRLNKAFVRHLSESS